MDYAVHSIIPKHQSIYLWKNVSLFRHVLKTASLLELLHVSSAALLLLSAMRLKEVLFCFITARKNAIRPNTAMKPIKLTVRTVAASQTF